MPMLNAMPNLLPAVTGGLSTGSRLIGRLLTARPELLVANSDNIEGWAQLAELGLAFVLSAAVGFERELRQKSAGLRTHTLVGIGAALFMLVSKYGFNDVLETGRVVVDPSRVAAQIVTGVGFLGAGLIFVRGGSVKGLTTAASIWVTAAIGAAAGAGLPLLGLVATVVYFVVALGFPQLSRRLPGSSRSVSVLQVRYPDGKGVLRQLLKVTTDRGFAIDQISTGPRSAASNGSAESRGVGDAMVEVTMRLHGKGSLNDLAARLSEVPDVDAVVASEANEFDE